MKFINCCLLLLIFFSCQSNDKDKAQRIVDNAIKAHGGDIYNQVALSFDFRDKHYSAYRHQGTYEYTREFTDTVGKVKDILNNEGFQRLINDQHVDLSEEKAHAYAQSINSVIYFTLLPYGLNDKAVNKEYLEEVTVKGQPYHKVKITFDQEGGGSDYEDEYIYWFHKDHHTMDYLAYTFHVNGGGMRFRKVYNRRKVKGLLIADHHNFKPVSDTVSLEHLDQAWENHLLKKVSDIELRNVVVELIN